MRRTLFFFYKRRITGFDTAGVIDRVFVDALPTEGISRDFASDSSGTDPFIDAGHCQESSAADGYLTIRSDERAAQIRKARAIYRFLTPDILAAGNDATIVLEFDTRVPADTRWHIALVNLDKRGGDTSPSQYTDYDPGADNYNTAGLGFWHGVSNSTGLYQINGRNSGYNRGGEAIGDMSDVWIHMRAEMPLNDTWITWTLTNRDTGEQIDTGNSDYSVTFDSDCGILNGIELHTWTTTSVDIDNISVKAVRDISQNRIFTVRNTGTSYIYNGTTPKAITA